MSLPEKTTVILGSFAFVTFGILLFNNRRRRKKTIPNNPPHWPIDDYDEMSPFLRY